MKKTYTNRDPQMGMMTMSMMKKGRMKPMMSKKEMDKSMASPKMKLMKKGMRNRKMAGKGMDE